MQAGGIRVAFEEQSVSGMGVASVGAWRGCMSKLRGLFFEYAAWRLFLFH